MDALPIVMDRELKSIPPMMSPMRGVRISLTRDVTIAVKALPMMIPTAMSTTFPFRAKALNSSKSFMF